MSAGGNMMSIGGMIEKDVSGYLTQGVVSKNLQIGVRKAKDAENAGYASAAGYLDPYAQQGQRDYTRLSDLVNQGAYDTNPQFNFDFQADPGYQFRQQEQQDAIQGSAAAKGSLLSGATLKALAKYSGELASQEYGNAYTRARSGYEFDATNRQTEMSNRYGRQAALGQVGVDMGTRMSDLAYSHGQTLADLQLMKYNALANSWRGVGDVANQQGQHLQEIGQMDLGGGGGGGGGNMSSLASFGGGK
jgi:hypothetical protein